MRHNDNSCAPFRGRGRPRRGLEAIEHLGPLGRTHKLRYVNCARSECASTLTLILYLKVEGGRWAHHDERYAATGFQG